MTPIYLGREIKHGKKKFSSFPLTRSGWHWFWYPAGRCALTCLQFNGVCSTSAAAGRVHRRCLSPSPVPSPGRCALLPATAPGTLLHVGSGEKYCNRAEVRQRSAPCRPTWPPGPCEDSRQLPPAPSSVAGAVRRAGAAAARLTASPLPGCYHRHVSSRSALVAARCRSAESDPGAWKSGRVTPSTTAPASRRAAAGPSPKHASPPQRRGRPFVKNKCSLPCTNISSKIYVALCGERRGVREPALPIGELGSGWPAGERLFAGSSSAHLQGWQQKTDRPCCLSNSCSLCNGGAPRPAWRADLPSRSQSHAHHIHHTTRISEASSGLSPHLMCRRMLPRRAEWFRGDHSHSQSSLQINRLRV